MSNWVRKRKSSQKRTGSTSYCHLSQQLLTVPSWRGWCQREYSGVLRKLEFLFWLSFTYEKQTHDRMSHYPHHNKSLSTRHSSSANRGTFWATRWKVPSNTIKSLYPFFRTHWKTYILLSVPDRLCNFISRPLYSRFYSQSWVFFETSIKCLWISFKNIFIMSNYPWRLHSLWRGGWWKTMMLFLQMSFAENARSEADQMTSPFQVFFNRWRWKENAKKWILVWNFFFQIPLILSIFWLLSGQKKTLRSSNLISKGPTYIQMSELKSNQVHLKTKGQR